MNVFGIGIDVVEVGRIASSISEFGDRFVQRIFTPEEIAYCQTKARPELHYAARFAAKEAVIKALSGDPGIEWHGIEVGKESSGKPVIWLHGTTAKIALQAGIRKLHVSISHDGDNAVAFVVAEGVES